MSSTHKTLYTIIVILCISWISYSCAVLVHEWCHGTLAYLLGYKSSPLSIHYGGFGWDNILWQQVDQNVNDTAIAFIGHPYQAGIILIIPPIVINGGLGFLTLAYLNKKTLPAHTWSATFLYSFMLWNIGGVF